MHQNLVGVSRVRYVRLYRQQAQLGLVPHLGCSFTQSVDDSFNKSITLTEGSQLWTKLGYNVAETEL